MAPPDIAPTRGRRSTYWLVALTMLAGLTWFFDRLVDERVNPNRDVAARVAADGEREIVLRQDSSGHYVASGEINGVQVLLLLDTGATTVSVPEHIAERAGLQRGARSRVLTANGSIDVYDTQIERLSIAGLVLENVAAGINPHMHDDAVLLGMSALRELHMTQANRTLTIRTHAPGDTP